MLGGTAETDEVLFCPDNAGGDDTLGCDELDFDPHAAIPAVRATVEINAAAIRVCGITGPTVYNPRCLIDVRSAALTWAARPKLVAVCLTVDQSVGPGSPFY